MARTQDDRCALCVGFRFDGVGEQIDETIVEGWVGRHDATFDVEIDDTAVLEGPAEIGDGDLYLGLDLALLLCLRGHGDRAIVHGRKGKVVWIPGGLGALESKGDEHGKDTRIDDAGL